MQAGRSRSGLGEIQLRNRDAAGLLPYQSPPEAVADPQNTARKVRLCGASADWRDFNKSLQKVRKDEPIREQLWIVIRVTIRIQTTSILHPFALGQSSVTT